MAEYTFMSDLGKAMWEEKKRKDMQESSGSGGASPASSGLDDALKVMELEKKQNELLLQEDFVRDVGAAAIGPRIPRVAKGGPVKKDRMALVAEEGPEFYVDKSGKTKFLDEPQTFTPSRSGTIVPNDEVRKLVRAYLNGEK